MVHSDHNLIGAFCGATRTQPITVEATSGNLSDLFVKTSIHFLLKDSLSDPSVFLSLPGVISVYFEANVSSDRPQGFNASFWVRRCRQGSEAGEDGSPVCQGGAQCSGGLCQCTPGYGGPYCDRPLCPGGCGLAEGRGSCNLVRGTEQ